MAGCPQLFLLAFAAVHAVECVPKEKRLMRSMSTDVRESPSEVNVSKAVVDAGVRLSPRFLTELPLQFKSSLPQGIEPLLVKVRQLVETNSSVFSACMTDRVLKTLSVQMARNVSAWEENLSPNVAKAYRHQKKFPGKGVAVLVTGQVRTGTSQLATSSLKDHVFDPLLKRNKPTGTFPVHTFAFLEFTSGGYQGWQHVGNIHRPRDVTRFDVEAMLKTYGAEYTLEEADGKNRKPNFTAEGCLDPKDSTYGGDGTMAEQWYKVHAAIQMMKEHESRFNEPFQYAVRLRPDLRVMNSLNLDPPFDTYGIPFVCATGGGGADCLMTMKRWAAEALDNTWRLTADCPLSVSDDCRSKEFVHYCETLAAHKRTGASKELCDHYLWLSNWRQGVAMSGCGTAIDFVRPPQVE